MTNAHLRELAGPAGYGISVTGDARWRVKYRAQPAVRIMDLFEALLVKSEGVTRGLCDSIAGTLGTRVLAEGGGIKTRRGFGWGLLGDSDKRYQQASPKA